MAQSLSPAAQAAELRRRATALSGPDRDYYLWLAIEWDKTAVRQTAAPPHTDHRPQKPH